MEYLPYTYLIGWSDLNKFYYGVEYARKTKIANPCNLWVTYFTSSNIVSYFRETYGEPDIIQIRKIFSKGSDIEKMENSILWEKKVLSKIDISDEKWLNGRIGGDICPESNKKISLIRYNVENVFQSNEIKQKIKETNLERYGVDHPSKSSDLLLKREDNNLKKYGYSHTFQIPEVKEKINLTMVERYGVKSPLQSEEIKEKQKNTLIERYGVINAGQIPSVKNKVKTLRENLSNREIVKLLRKYSKIFKIKFGIGWYQSSDEDLLKILINIQNKFGIYDIKELDSLDSIKEKKYSSSIKILQNRQIVFKIKQYKQKYPKEIKLGRVWDRKSEDYLQIILQDLINKYGYI